MLVTTLHPMLPMMVKPSLAVIVALGLLGATAGCATMVKGRTQVVDVRSSPAGATVRVQPTSEVLTTPCRMVLSRKSSYVVRIEKNGYETQSVTLLSKASSSLWRNAVWVHPIGWIIGVSIDLGTGSGYDLQPDEVNVTLSPATDHDRTGSGEAADAAVLR